MGIESSNFDFNFRGSYKYTGLEAEKYEHLNSRRKLLTEILRERRQELYEVLNLQVGLIKKWKALGESIYEGKIKRAWKEYPIGSTNPVAIQSEIKNMEYEIECLTSEITQIKRDNNAIASSIRCIELMMEESDDKRVMVDGNEIENMRKQIEELKFANFELRSRNSKLVKENEGLDNGLLKLGRENEELRDKIAELENKS